MSAGVSPMTNTLSRSTGPSTCSAAFSRARRPSTGPRPFSRAPPPDRRAVLSVGAESAAGKVARQTVVSELGCRARLGVAGEEERNHVVPVREVVENLDDPRQGPTGPPPQTLRQVAFVGTQQGARLRR